MRLPIRAALASIPLLLGGFPPAVAQDFVGGYGEPEYDAQWGLFTTGVLLAHEAGFTGRGVSIGLVDTGLDISHDEFVGRLAPTSLDFFSQGPVLGDPHGHGTHIGGIIAANRDGFGMVGVAPRARLAPLRLLNQFGGISFPLREVALPELYALALDDGVRLFNNSWGINFTVTNVSRQGYLNVFPRAVETFREAARRDSLLVWATGNNAATQPAAEAGLPFHFPELEDSWLAVTAIGPTGQLASYSNECGVAAGWCLAAPGGDIVLVDGQLLWGGIFSTFPDQNYAYGFGTSMAAPHVTGAAAIAREIFPSASWSQIRQLLLATAADWGEPGLDPVFGWGLLDVGAMMETIREDGRTLFANARWAALETQRAIGDTVSARLAARRLPGSAHPRGGVWATGFGGGSRLAGSLDRPGASALRTGKLIGLEGELVDGLVAGMAAGVSRTRIAASGNADEGIAEGAHALAYLGLDRGSWFVDAIAGVGRFTQELTRRHIPGTGRTVLGRHDIAGHSRMHGFAHFADLRAGMRLEGAGMLAEPFAHARWSGLGTRSGEEEGADIFGLSVHAGRVGTGEAGVGLRLAAQLELDGFRLVPELSAAYGRSFGSRHHTVAVSLLDTEFAARTASLGRDILRVSAGLSLEEASGRLAARLDYRGSFRSGARSHSISGSLSLRF